MSQPQLIQAHNRKSVAEETQLVEETTRESKRPKICIRAVAQALSEWRMDATLVVFSHLADPKSGGSADIAKATIINSERTSPEFRDRGAVLGVAVKKFRFDDDTTNKRAATFANELRLLSELYHENIARLLGFVENDEGRIAWIVLPWEANGNLREFVRSQDWAIPERLFLIHDVACGIEYLHSRDPPICHADLKSLNIIVNSNNRAVITDFGSARKLEASKIGIQAQDTLSRPTSSDKCCTSPEQARALLQLTECGTLVTLTGPVYSLRWAAPEILEDEIFGLASDIWAFGWICWEIMTGSLPFEDLRGDVDVILRVTQGDLPIVASNEQISQVKSLCDLMTQCWAMDPAERPAARECKGRTNWVDKIAPAKRDADMPDQSHVARALCALGNTRHANGEAEEAAAQFLQALHVARSAGIDLLVAVAALGLGNAKASQGYYFEAAQWIGEARKVFIQVRYQVGVANATWSLGEIYRLREEYSKAEASYAHAMNMYTLEKDQMGVANAKLGLGDIYRLRDQYSEAESAYLAAEYIYTQFKDHSGVAHVAWALGEVYRLQAKFVKAEASYIEARRIYDLIDDQSGIANTTWGLGEVYRLLDESEKAEASYIKSRELYARINDRKGAADAEWGLGEVYRRQGKYSMAKSSYTKAQEISACINYESGLASAASSQERMKG